MRACIDKGMTTTQTSKAHRKALMKRIEILSQEARECTTDAAYRCVKESIDDARRQLREALG